MAESALSLVERLRARLLEIEELARAMPPWPWIMNGGGYVFAADGTTVAEADAPRDHLKRTVAAFITIHDPAHVLRTVAAHRKIIARHKIAPPTPRSTGPHCWWCTDGEGLEEAWPCPDVRDLAAVYFPEAPDA